MTLSRFSNSTMLARKSLPTWACTRFG
jgi:hypothetical protein